MPKSNHAPFPCPNCNTVVEKNYCPQCGQPAHLHDGSFWSMMMHFFAHYLHYESKFLQTLKMVMFKPGRATMDFKEKKRARHVEPMSLYIFVVVSYFIASGLVANIYSSLGVGEYSTATLAKEKAEIAERKARWATGETTKFERIIGAKNYKKFRRFMYSEGIEIDRKLDPLGTKIFFFLVPVFASLLALFYAFKKYTFVEHTVFSIHVHTFWFVMRFCLDLLDVLESSFFEILGILLLFIYAVVGQVRFYRTHWLYATLVFVISFGIYLLVLALILFAIILLFF